MALTEGPLGFPMPDKTARAVDALLRTLPKTKDYEYRQSLATRPPTELNPGERSDVSWISTESVDRMGEVVVAKGHERRPVPAATRSSPSAMRTGLPPVGKSLWRKRVKDGELRRHQGQDACIRRGRSRGRPATSGRPTRCSRWSRRGCSRARASAFCRRRSTSPTRRRRSKHGWGDRVGLVIDEWLLLEYACVFLPANQDALVESVAKNGLALADDVLHGAGAG